MGRKRLKVKGTDRGDFKIRLITQVVCVCVRENRESVCFRFPDELVLSIQTKK